MLVLKKRFYLLVALLNGLTSLNSSAEQIDLSEGWIPSVSGEIVKWKPTKELDKINLKQFEKIEPPKKFLFQWHQFPEGEDLTLYNNAFGFSAMSPNTMQSLGLDFRTSTQSKFGEIYGVDNFQDPKSLFLSSKEDFEITVKRIWGEHGWPALEYLWVNLENFYITPSLFSEKERERVIHSERKSENVSIGDLISRGELQDEFQQRHLNRMMILHRHLKSFTTSAPNMKLAFEQAPYFAWAGSLLENARIRENGVIVKDWWKFAANDYLLREETKVEEPLFNFNIFGQNVSTPGAVIKTGSRMIDLLGSYLLYIYQSNARVIDQAAVDKAYEEKDVLGLMKATACLGSVAQTEFLVAQAHHYGTGEGQLYPKLPQIRLMRPYYEFGLAFDTENRSWSPAGGGGNRIPIHQYAAFNTYIWARLLQDGLVIWDDRWVNNFSGNLHNNYSQIEAFAAAAHVLAKEDEFIDSSETLWRVPIYNEKMKLQIEAFDKRYEKSEKILRDALIGDLTELAAAAKRKYLFSKSKREAYYEVEKSKLDKNLQIDLENLSKNKEAEILAWKTLHRDEWSAFQVPNIVEAFDKGAPIVVAKKKGNRYLVALSQEHLKEGETEEVQFLLDGVTHRTTLVGPWSKVIVIE